MPTSHFTFSLAGYQVVAQPGFASSFHSKQALAVGEQLCISRQQKSRIYIVLLCHQGCLTLRLDSSWTTQIY